MHGSLALRETIRRLSLPLFLVISVLLLVIGKVSHRFDAKEKSAVISVLLPLHQLGSGPVRVINSVGTELAGFWSLHQENAALLAENNKLLQWEAAALSLQAENQALKAQLNWMPERPAPTVAGKIISEAGGIFVRSALLELPPHSPVKSGWVALNLGSLAGRVTGVSKDSAQILLINDVSSRVPVMIGKLSIPALMVGNGGADPDLLYWPVNDTLKNNQPVVTSGAGGMFPAGIPVGYVRFISRTHPVVIPLYPLSQVNILRLYDFGKRPEVKINHRNLQGLI